MEELSTPETAMYETIGLLMSLPEEERQKMEEAVEYKFTMDSPAPKREAGAEHNQLIVTLNVGTTAGAQILCEMGLNPAVLNFAHAYNCGGGFEHAGGSQEEACFRTSSLFLSLWPHRREDDGPGVLTRNMWIGDFDEALPRKTSFYPHTECGAIYSPYAKLARKVKMKNSVLYSAKDVERLHSFAFISVAAQDVPRDEERGIDFDPDLLRQKLRTILHLAVKHGHDSVVLGAFGCGFFGNEPEDVAGTCADLLFEEFEGAFRVVAMAIPDKDSDTLDEFTRNFPMIQEKELGSRLKEFKKRKMSGASVDAAPSSNEKKEGGQQSRKQSQAGKTGAVSFEIGSAPNAKGQAPLAAADHGDAERGCCSSCTVM